MEKFDVNVFLDNLFKLPPDKQREIVSILIVLGLRSYGQFYDKVLLKLFKDN